MARSNQAADRTRSLRPGTRSGVLALIGVLLCGCAGPERGSEGERAGREQAEARPAAAPVPWPGSFEGQSVLMAVRVVVVGPEGLREHAAVMQDPDHHAYLEQVTAEGFLRRTTLRPGVDYLAPIRGRLDGMQIFAEQELLVIERPGPVQLTVEASGDVLWRDVSTGQERRAQRLLLPGSEAAPAPRPSPAGGTGTGG